MSAIPLRRIEGKYEILEKLGEGGMGAVYKVRHRLLGDVRVIKIMSPQLVADDEFKARFQREAQVAIQLRHPNIAHLIDFTIDEEDGTAFIVMEFIDGMTLEEVLRHSGPPPLGLAVEIGQQALRALACLHEKGFVHRDISPDNLMLTADADGLPLVKLIDLGIAKILGAGAGTDKGHLTGTGTFLGKVRYSSPEQFGTEGAAMVDARGDLYSLAVVLYELLTGRYPIQGRDPSSLIAGHLFRPPLDFAESDPAGKVPLKLRELILRALAKEPAQRFATSREMGAALGRLRAQGDLGEGDLKRALTRLPSGTVRVPLPPPGSTQDRLNAQFSLHTNPSSHTAAPGADGGRTLAPSPSRSPEIELRASPADEAVKTFDATVSLVPFPQRIRRFTLHELIARGRSGCLYKAYDPVRGGLFGLKVVPIVDEIAHERLLRGGRIWLNLTHPNLLKVLEIHPAERDEPAIIVTELVDGVDLATLIRGRSLTLEAKLEIALQLSEALAYLHDQGLIHREVKPSNVLVSRGPHALLLDSGIARPSNPDLESLTRTGMIVGDLSYMSPEQLLGKAEVRSDIFSLGALFYELLLGEQPKLNRRAEVFDRLHRDHSLSQRLTELVKKCLAEIPDERYASAHDLADSLRGFMASATPRSRTQRQVVALHGIRTYAGWQRTLAEVAGEAFWSCRFDRWNFGYFSVIRFLQPWSRSARVEWFRRTYREEFSLGVDSGADLPSIVAHSFGTYILGNALLRYPYLRFNKVILCGSILPIDFPWPAVLDSGQVQSMRNEYGARDFWTGLVEHFIQGTGASGRKGFKLSHPRVEQERFEFSHSEYFERSHMEGRWIPFLSRIDSYVAPRVRPEIGKASE